MIGLGLYVWLTLLGCLKDWNFDLIWTSSFSLLFTWFKILFWWKLQGAPLNNGAYAAIAIPECVWRRVEIIANERNMDLGRKYSSIVVFSRHFIWSIRKRRYSNVPWGSRWRNNEKKRRKNQVMADKRKLQGKHGGRVLVTFSFPRVSNCYADCCGTHPSLLLRCSWDRQMSQKDYGRRGNVWRYLAKGTNLLNTKFEYIVWLYTCHNYIQKFYCNCARIILAYCSVELCQ